MRIAHGALSIITLTVVLCAGCFPTRQLHILRKTELARGRSVKAPSKIHVCDGSVILADSGFTCLHDTIFTTGDRYSLTRELGHEGKWKIPLDSVAAVEYQEMRDSNLRGIGSVLLVATETAEIAVGSACILKAIFGSCPTVYSFDGDREHLEAECFSYSIGKMFEADDLDRLSQIAAAGESLTLRTKNEALETHYADVLRLSYVDHPLGTEAFPTGNHDVFLTGDLTPPASAVNSEGTDVLAYVCDRDELAYETDSATAARMLSRGMRDWIECSVPISGSARSAKILLKVKNSLQSTVLVYDVMMRDQGLGALEWSRMLNQSWWYAWKLNRWYAEFSGIDVGVRQGGRYVCRDRIPDTGPIAWKSVGAKVPTWGCGDTLCVRLSFYPDNWIIDWIGFGFEDYPRPKLKDAAICGVRDQSGLDNEDYCRALEKDDGIYAIVYPGEHMDVSFRAPPCKEADRTYFLYSKGYYIEWVRGEWIREATGVASLDLSRRREVRERLTKAWIAKKNIFKEQFLKLRIPPWEPDKR